MFENALSRVRALAADPFVRIETGKHVFGLFAYLLCALRRKVVSCGGRGRFRLPRSCPKYLERVSADKRCFKWPDQARAPARPFNHAFYDLRRCGLEAWRRIWADARFNEAGFGGIRPSPFIRGNKSRLGAEFRPIESIDFCACFRRREDLGNIPGGLR